MHVECVYHGAENAWYLKKKKKMETTSMALDFSSHCPQARSESSLTLVCATAWPETSPCLQHIPAITCPPKQGEINLLTTLI